ncbi:hypothetical protein [Ekhidna sp.]
MKSLLLSLLLTGALSIGASEAPLQNNPDLDMQLDADLIFQKMVKVYDYDGRLVRELLLSDVTDNQISLVDHMILEESDYAFDFQGDYYYFGDSDNIRAIVN